MVNLWECMTHRATCPRPKDRIEQEIRDLDQRACLSGQEIEIGSTEQGWVLKILSCHIDEEREFVILLPKDASKPVEVVANTIWSKV